MEFIKEHRYNKLAGPQYLIHWQGYQEKDESWEPAENFTEPSLLETYWAIHPSRNRKTFEVGHGNELGTVKLRTAYFADNRHSMACVLFNHMPMLGSQVMSRRCRLRFEKNVPNSVLVCVVCGDGGTQYGFSHWQVDLSFQMTHDVLRSWSSSFGRNILSVAVV